MRIVDFGCTTTGIFIVTPSLGGLPTKAEESPLPMRQTCPRRTPTRNFMVSGRANRYYTLLKGDLEVIVAKGNLIIPRRNSTTGCSFMSYPGQIIIIIIIINLGKTWVSENIDNLVSKYIRQWLELPICATLSTLVLSKSKYGISLILPSTKFAQCQVVMRNALKSSPNTDINALWSLTSSGCNIQYDQYRNTKQVLTAIRDDNEDRIRHELKSQGFVLSSILLQGSKHTRHLWTKVHCNMPRNIFNFIVKYINNTLPTKKNLCKWSLSPTSACSFCFQSETLQHVVSSCKSYLQDGRYTWRHNSVLLHLAKTLSSVVNSTLYADLPFFPSPSLITGDSLRPDLVLVSNSSCVYLLEVTVGFESNIQINSDRKATKYLPLIADLQNSYSTVKLINLSMSALGILGTPSESFPSMLRDLNFDDTTKHKILSKTINIAVRCTYYIFCRRNKPWTNPNLLDY